MQTFKSADGTLRCTGCHLLPCECTCRPGVLRRILTALAIIPPR